MIPPSIFLTKTSSLFTTLFNYILRYNYFNRRVLQINPLIVIFRKNKPLCPPLSLEGTHSQWVYKLTYLVLSMNSHLNFKQHFSLITTSRQDDISYSQALQQFHLSQHLQSVHLTHASLFCPLKPCRYLTFQRVQTLSLKIILQQLRFARISFLHNLSCTKTISFHFIHISARRN